MTLTLLHLSDLHYQKHMPEQIAPVLDALFTDLKSQCGKHPDLFLAFSGDLVQSATDAGYEAFLERFEAPLNALQLPVDRRLVVPGNHDIDRHALNTILSAHHPTVASFADERQFNDALSNLSATLFAPQFAAYKKAEHRFAKYNCTQSQIGGTGWDFPDGIGIYCLNTSLCSSGGLKDSRGDVINDKERLHVDTRSLHAWLAASSSTTRILMMHHPLEWLSPWAQKELGQTISTYFRLVICGHLHSNDASQVIRNERSTVYCAAPPLFSSKFDPLGYSFISIDGQTKNVQITYRAWSVQRTFVAGSHLSGTESGTLSFGVSMNETPQIQIRTRPTTATTEQLLRAEFDAAITCYSSKRALWVERDLCDHPEIARQRKSPSESSATFAHNIRSCIVRAPQGFGLSSLARFIAYEDHRASAGQHLCCVLNSDELPTFRQGVLEHVVSRAISLGGDPAKISSIIVDNWQLDKNGRRAARDLRHHFPQIPIVFMCGVEDCADIGQQLEAASTELPATIYLWALSRSRVRELVTQFLSTSPSLDDDAVTKKVLADIDALNIHRTPSNCLMILKLLEQAFDDSPVNRTEMIGRVLYLLFYQFDKIPRYATRPDLKDCEYALGYLCEWLIRSSRHSFTKNEYSKKVREYCDKQVLDFDTEVLFSFLVSENILISKGITFEFRFRYWLYYFAAHRMLHDDAFASHILGERRYANLPEIVEFYTGIDRRRTNAVQIITNDLRQMIEEFQSRTGIVQAFNPYQHARWVPDSKSIARMQEDVAASVADSTMPKPEKDAIADKLYDRSKPYNQQLAVFIEHSSLAQMVSMMRGAARALRNSDHVSPESKKELLRQVLDCWHRVSQILVLLSYVLAERGSASFEGMGFVLDEEFEQHKDLTEKWKNIMAVVPDNVVKWFQEDIFSKKMGALLYSFIEANKDTLGELLALLVIVQQRPPGWENEVERFVVRSDKNAFSLSRVHGILMEEFRTSISNEQTRQSLRRLAAMSVAKHLTGVKHPNTKLIEQAAAQLDSKVPAAGTPKSKDD